MLTNSAVNVDVDWMDPEYIKSMPIKPHDQTSNQLWVDIQLGHPSNAELLAQTAKELKDQGWLAIYTRMVIEPLRPMSARSEGFVY
jgi:transaldolase